MEADERAELGAAGAEEAALEGQQHCPTFREDKMRRMEANSCLQQRDGSPTRLCPYLGSFGQWKWTDSRPKEMLREEKYSIIPPNN
jgi:hypothetical protein